MAILIVKMLKLFLLELQDFIIWIYKLKQK